VRHVVTHSPSSEHVVRKLFDGASGRRKRNRGWRKKGMDALIANEPVGGPLRRCLAQRKRDVLIA
jgi:hypothetical protein